jgi:hypothetical protein
MQHAEQGEQVEAQHLPAERCGVSDIVERLRNWRTVHLTQLRYVMESAADEIERLRLSAKGDCPVPENAANENNESVGKTGGDFGQPSLASAGSHNTDMATARLSAANTWLQEEIKRLRLTDAELDAIRWAADTLCVGWDDLKPDDKGRSRKAADTLRWMVARLS